MSDFAWNIGMSACKMPYFRIAWLAKGGERDQRHWKSVFGTRLYWTGRWSA